MILLLLVTMTLRDLLRLAVFGARTKGNDVTTAWQQTNDEKQAAARQASALGAQMGQLQQQLQQLQSAAGELCTVPVVFPHAPCCLACILEVLCVQIKQDVFLQSTFLEACLIARLHQQRSKKKGESLLRSFALATAMDVCLWGKDAWPCMSMAAMLDRSRADSSNTAQEQPDPAAGQQIAVADGSASA